MMSLLTSSWGPPIGGRKRKTEGREGRVRDGAGLDRAGLLGWLAGFFFYNKTLSLFLFLFSKLQIKTVQNLFKKKFVKILFRELDTFINLWH